MNRIIKYLLIPTVVIIITNNCTSFTLIKPVYPEVGNPKSNPDKVESLQPVLEWEPSKYTEASFDLIVLEVLKDESFWEGTKRSIGDTVYYKEDLKGTSHKIEVELKPDTEYYWSVRIRRGDEVSDWSRYNYEVFLLLSYTKISNSLFRFKTPNN